jgi:hypothetical protein
MQSVLAHVRRQGVAYLALFVALGGTSYAAVTLPKNSVGTAQLKNSAVTGAKVKKGSLRKIDFAAGQLPAGPAGPAGASGPAGPTGAAGAAGTTGSPGSFSTTLPSGDTIRGTYDTGGIAAAASGLANTSISFLSLFSAAPTVVVVAEKATPPAECPGTAEVPQAKPGFLCIYEEGKLNTNGLLVNGVQRSGATIYIFSEAAGTFYSFGTWAATAP